MAVELQGVINELLEGSIKTIGKKPVINDLNVVENGIYTPPSGVDGFAPVNVNIPEPELVTLNVKENGIYTPSSNIDGFDEVVVNIPTPTTTLETLNVNNNGTYTPSAGVDGFNQVNVNVQPDVQYVRNSFANGSTSGSRNIATNIFDSKASINNFLLSLESYYFSGSNRYTCNTVKNSYNSESGLLNISWTAQSGNTTQYFSVVYVDDLDKIHALSDWTTYNTDGTYEFDLSSDLQNLPLDNFIIDFKNFVSGGASFTGNVTKIIENNKLKVTFPFSSSAVSFDARILYIK
jgi:hypothetical protein